MSILSNTFDAFFQMAKEIFISLAVKEPKTPFRSFAPGQETGPYPEKQ